MALLHFNLRLGFSFFLCLFYVPHVTERSAVGKIYVVRFGVNRRQVNVTVGEHHRVIHYIVSLFHTIPSAFIIDGRQREYATEIKTI